MNSFGRLFRVSIFGESQGICVGACIDGVPPGIKIVDEELNELIKKRKPTEIHNTSRKENDIPEFLSGIYKGFTTGAPVTVIFKNLNHDSSWYETNNLFFRPGHADFTAYTKYKGFNDIRGGGHFSGRLTLPIIVAGYFAQKIIDPITVKTKIIEIGGQKQNFEKIISMAIEENDSVGGIIECRVENAEVGLGEPFFDSFESVLSHAVFSIPAIKGIEFGAGFTFSKLKGSESNDVFINKDGKTLTNNNGGINGGITNGNDIVFRVVVKAPPSIKKPQQTYNWQTHKVETLIIEGNHDSCIVDRVQVVLTSITECVIADFKLIKSAYDFYYILQNQTSR
ncbi:MAG: chorismate synthase [Bacteroidales bacterium]|nr:chorismate synthase [Bacteroidales bacterium]